MRVLLFVCKCILPLVLCPGEHGYHSRKPQAMSDPCFLFLCIGKVFGLGESEMEQVVLCAEIVHMSFLAGMS